MRLLGYVCLLIPQESVYRVILYMSCNGLYKIP